MIVAVVAALPALLGVVMVVQGVLRWHRCRRLSADGLRATARVVDNQVESLSEGRMAFLPVVRFRTMAGQEVTAILENERSFRSHLVDRAVEVSYDPADPSRAVPVGARDGGTAIVFGLLFIAFGVGAYLMFRSVDQGGF